MADFDVYRSDGVYLGSVTGRSIYRGDGVSLGYVANGSTFRGDGVMVGYARGRSILRSDGVSLGYIDESGRIFCGDGAYYGGINGTGTLDQVAGAALLMLLPLM
jgi:hypothetical protein